MKTFKKSFEVNDYNYIFRSQVPDKALFDDCFNDSFFKKNEYYTNATNNTATNGNVNSIGKFFGRSNTNNMNYTNDTFDNMNTNRSYFNMNNDKNNYSLFTQKKILGNEIVIPITKTEIGK